MNAKQDCRPPAEDACPALSDELAWRDAPYTPGAILDNERMAVHAAELAAALGAPVQRRGTGPLLARFAGVRRALSKAYAGLAAKERPHEAVPAEGWLLDNAHIVEEQVREIDDDLPRGYLIELPRVRSGPMAGYPRVYVACLDYLLHTDARLDPESLAAYVTAFQSRGSLTIGELWAVPIMLRVGLLIVVGGVATAVATDQTKVRAAHWANKLLHDPDRVVATLAEIERDSVDPALLVELLRLLRDRDAMPSTIEWIRSQAASLGATTEELGRRLHLQRAADQLSIANAITSMRTIGTYEWRKFFERTSRVEQMLCRDRDGTYAATDRTSRDRCRRALERIARQSGFDEARVARAALDLAARHREGARAHVGYYFEQRGRRELERACGARLSPCEWVTRTVVEHPRAFYFSLLLGLTGALSLLLWTAARRAEIDPGLAAVLALSLLLGASEIALSVLGATVVALLPPRLLSRLSVEDGILPEHRTMVVAAVLLDSIPTVDRLIEDLEIRALANPDPNLHFALLSDFCDANADAKKDDEPILARAVAAVAALNERRPLPSGLPKFSLFHRKRVRNDAEGCFMGWERKRGKLEELNSLILGVENTTFEVVTAPTDLVRSIRYVITLDADTELPRAAAMKLVATLAHPLNRPVLDSSGSIVVEGYAVIQPRVGTVPASSRRSVYARICAGPSGIDPYTTAVSDVYQDLFGEGSYIGKGIYDVQAFASVHRNRVSDNRLLSHDLFEGIFARTALASDIELLDDQPSSYAVVANRGHRWIRGDWQLLPFLGRRVVGTDGRMRSNDLPFLGFWKIVDNLRRSLLAPSLVGVFFLGCMAWPARAGTTAAFEALVLATPLALSSFAGLMRSARSPGGPESVWENMKRGAAQTAMAFLVLFDQAVLAVDAIARTLYRLVVSKRRLLEWQSTGLDKAGAGAPRRMWLEVLALAAAAALVDLEGGRIGVCAPIATCWMMAPVIVGWLCRPARAIDPASRLSADDKQALRTTARKTWQYFERFVIAEEHWLPPDNFQEEPRAVIAHRTSPTNIGLYLLSAVSARDFGYIGTRELLQRLRDTLGTLEVLERAEGHILNWYDTRTCKPLEPRYVSTVDSGNLAAYLWTVRQACEEIVHRPMVGPEAVDAVVDALKIARVKSKMAAPRPRDGDGARTGHALEPDELVRELEALCATTHKGRKDMWREVAERTRREWLEEADALAPHLAWLRSAPTALSTAPWFASLRAELTSALTPYAVQAAGPLLRQICLDREGAAGDPGERAWLHELSVRVESAVHACGSLVQGLRLVGQRAQALADGMNFAFLFDADRSLFSIGYDVATAHLDASRYDLLATEARLASLLAIAKGDVPERHWFHLGRARCQVGSRRALLSWSGSMFEYLMPLLVMKSYPDTLLDETHAGVVEAHRADARRHGVPWGASEAAYNVMDLSMTYQYRAFGVPKLGLRPGLEEDLVIAPYATALGSMVRPDLAVDNLRALAREGLDGAFGFYDSIDYTPSRMPPGRRGVVVKTYMAHHQGMTLVALGNALLGAPMQRRFHGDPRVRATELLLEERVPAGAPLLAPQPRRPPAPVAAGEDLGALEHVGLEEHGALRTHLLGHGELTTIITSAGTGVTMWRGLDLVRFREDGRLDPSGTFVYIRNRSTGQSWSAGFEPSRITPSSYRVTFSVDHVEIHRRDGDLETTTEVVASPEHCVEVRRITLVNHGQHACEVELTTYAEIVLCPRSADVAHRAFENMFVEFEEDATLGALFVTRRDRANGASSPWLVQMLAAESDGWSPMRCDSSRFRFVGRGRDLSSPEGLWDDSPSKVAKHPLDPAAILRRSVVIEPQKTARIALVTGVAPSRAEVVDLAHRYVSSTHVDRAFELAWADARVELNHLRIGAAQSFRFQRLLSFILDPQKPLRAAADSFAARGDGRGALWAHGISGDLPIVVLRIDDGVVGAVCGELLLAHEFFRLNNFAIDLVFWNEEPAGYLQPLQDQLIAAIQAGFAQGYLDKRGGVFVKRANQIDERQRGLVLGAARVVLRTSGGSLARQLRLAGEEAAPSRPPRQKVAVTKPATAPRLVFDNGAGGFSPDGREYVIGGPTPAPWCNVLANERFGTVVSERGGGFTWSENSQRYRLTPWSNDACCDPKGEAIYVRDEQGFVWCATTGAVRHAASSSSFEGTTRGVRHELTVFVPPDESVKVYRLRLDNQTDSKRRLMVYGYVEWVLGSNREASRITTITEWDPHLEVAFAYNRSSPASERCSFFRATAPISSATCDRDEFFGRFGKRAHPRGVAEGDLSASSGAGLDPCAALEVAVEIPPRASAEVSFVLGDAETRSQAKDLARRWGANEATTAALARTRMAWDELLGVVHVETPDPALDLLINRWLLHQVLACRVWGRSAFYQSGGAFGFRDQLQDILALVYARPDMAREHLLRAAARQFEEGDVQHWWHPDDGSGIRTRCSDDMLWLPFATMEYVRTTHDHDVLDEKVAFLVERPVPPDRHDLFGRPRASEGSASLYEHCARAIDAGLTRGTHGLPLIRGGDWNDGMDRVGAGGQGESVWLGWFLYAVLRDFASLAVSRADTALAERLHDEMKRLAQSIEDHGWDGAWYRRAYFDDGTPLGSHASSECRIDAIAQSWAVIAGAGDTKRARRAVDQAEAQLVETWPPLMRLLTPAFDGRSPDPGYIRSYPAGVRENGGQYTHGVLWTVQALAMLGEGDRAYALYSKLNPIVQSRTGEDVHRYRVEPYVVAGDVYSAPDHEGRGGWTWYTGAAGWMYRIAVEWLLGLRLRGNSLSLHPCVPTSWPTYSIRLRRGKTTYEIRVDPGRDLRATLDGIALQGTTIALVDDGRVHKVLVASATSRQIAV